MRQPNSGRTGPGVPRDRIIRLDEKDNFWQMGETGPCGPCSEIHYDLGPEASELGHPNCAFPCECGRYVEIWNLVFMQFDRDAERPSHRRCRSRRSTREWDWNESASVLQGKISNYETDLLRPIIDEACEIFRCRIRRLRRIRRFAAHHCRSRPRRDLPDQRRHHSFKRRPRLCPAKDHAARNPPGHAAWVTRSRSCTSFPVLSSR